MVRVSLNPGLGILSMYAGTLSSLRSATNSSIQLTYHCKSCCHCTLSQLAEKPCFHWLAAVCCSSISNTAALAVANAIADNGCGQVQGILTSKCNMLFLPYFYGAGQKESALQ